MTDNLNGVMRSATENLHPNIGKLTAGGIERGVRKRRNRRISQIAGAAASVTAVFGVVAMVGAPGHNGSTGVSAASGSPVSSPIAAPTTAPATSASKPAADPVTGDEMATWLTQALQPYHFTGEQALDKGGSDSPTGPFATLRIGYPSGAGSVSLTVERAPWQAPSGTLPPYFSVQDGPDGSHLEIFDGPEWPAGNGDPSAKRIDVAWYRTDGTVVDIMVLNAVQEKGATTAPKLGLTVAQATQVVESRIWAKAIAAELAQPKPTKPSIPSGDTSKLQPEKNGGPSSGQSFNATDPSSH